MLQLQCCDPIYSMKSPFESVSQEINRRAFVKGCSLLAGGALLPASVFPAQSVVPKAPLIAYVGTFSSPLRDVLPTQVDLPPGNGRGIHIYQVNRATGALAPSGNYELGTSPSCLAVNASGTHLYSANETDRTEGNQGTVSAFEINRADGRLIEVVSFQSLNTSFGISPAARRPLRSAMPVARSSVPQTL
jgi:hypothetical protein